MFVFFVLFFCQFFKVLSYFLAPFCFSVVSDAWNTVYKERMLKEVILMCETKQTNKQMNNNKSKQTTATTTKQPNKTEYCFELNFCSIFLSKTVRWGHSLLCGPFISCFNQKPVIKLEKNTEEGCAEVKTVSTRQSQFDVLAFWQELFFQQLRHGVS